MWRSTTYISPLEGAGGQLGGAAVRRTPVEQDLSADEIIFEIAGVDMR